MHLGTGGVQSSKFLVLSNLSTNIGMHNANLGSTRLCAHVSTARYLHSQAQQRVMWKRKIKVQVLQMQAHVSSLLRAH
jgi:hypothetical protein